MVKIKRFLLGAVAAGGCLPHDTSEIIPDSLESAKACLGKLRDWL